jgi:hypothetical protein
MSSQLENRLDNIEDRLECLEHEFRNHKKAIWREMAEDRAGY